MIKTVDQYLESLNDGRQVWCMGEKVSDVRTHPTLSSIIKTACMDYVLPNHPDFRELFVTKDEDGEEINFLLTSPRSPGDLLRRRECYINGVKSGGGVMVIGIMQRPAPILISISAPKTVCQRKIG
jgi:4-hydroxyphenylacetate 3-monooxygenase